MKKDFYPENRTACGSSLDTSMKNLFAYGTLMCDDIMKSVSGCLPSCVPAVLKGYRRRSIRGELYPAATPDKDGTVEGVVYLEVPGKAWNRLDLFEGDMYARLSVEVEINEGTTIPADAYVVRKEYLHCLEQSDWDFNDFLRHGKADFHRHER